MPHFNRLLISELVYINKPNRIDSIYVFCGNLEEYLWRVEAGAIAFRRFGAKEIILFDDGVIGPWSPGVPANPTSVQRAERKLIEMGIPKNSIIILEGKVTQTIEEARALRDFMAKHGSRSLLLVTSPYHLRRAYWSVDHEFGLPVRLYTFTFDIEAHPELLSNRILIFEYLKLLIYRGLYS